MKNHSKKEPLYRKENTLARGNRHATHHSGSDYRHDRNTKATKHEIDTEVTHKGMAKNIKRGLDYTPLFRFLLSKVGKDWTAIHSEAVSRLDQEEPIWWMVAKHEEDKQDIFCGGDFSYYHGLYVDENNILQKVNPQANADSVNVYCKCHTWTLNGKVIVPNEKNLM